MFCVYILKYVSISIKNHFILIFFLAFQSNACIVWRRFANLWETCQSLFWACFGLVSLTDFELTGIKEFTRFWALLMFGSYSVCNIIVLLNMLIAMMSNSFQVSLFEVIDQLGLFGTLKLALQFIVTNAYFSVARTLTLVLHATLK